MHPLYTENEFKTAKSRQSLPLKCLHCRSTFPVPKHRIQCALSNDRNESYDFCSQACNNQHRILNAIPCTQCGNPVRKCKSQCRSKKQNHFCSQSCAAKWNNAHKKHGTRRSKLEKWLEERLTKLYPNLEIHFNRKDAILSELDIFIPSLLLAFELNGIFHYEPIYGQNKLNRIQSNDKRKFAACHEASIELCIIDNSSLKYFKEQRAMKFLKIIQDIINTRLSDSQPALPVSSRNHVEVV